jgi:hypothetical protein
MSFVNAGSTVPTPTEVSAALTAMMGFWSTVTATIIAGTAIDPVDAAVVRDVATGLTTDEVTASSVPAGIITTDSSVSFVSGVGGRVDWRTGVRRGSREVRGATFAIPMGGGQFTGGGNLTGACVANYASAAAAYITAVLAAGLVPVVYGRPLPASVHHGPLAGITAAITTGDMSAVPAFLRRRRT